MKAILTPEFLAELDAEPNDEQLGEIVIAAKTIKRPIEDAEELIRDRLERVGRINAAGISITMETRKTRWKVREAAPMFAAARTLLPDAELAPCLTYSSEDLKDAIARVRSIPKTGKAPDTAEKVFFEQLAPHCEQGTARVLKFL